MIRTRALKLLTLGLVSAALSEASPAASLPEGVVTAVRAICPNATMSAPNGVGALTPGGPIATPMVVDCEGDQSVQIMVAIETSHEDYTVVFKTNSWGASGRRWDNVSIRNFTLVYSQGCGGSCELAWHNDYKFKMVGKALILAEEERQAQSRGDDRTGLVYDDGSRVDYQAGTETVWRTVSGRRTEKLKHFSVSKPPTFDAFDPDEVNELRSPVSDSASRSEYASPADAMAAIGARPQSRAATGDLNGDGLADWANMVTVKNGSGEERLLLICTKDPDGMYRVAARSIAQPFPDRVDTEMIEIEGGHLFVYMSYTRGTDMPQMDMWVIKYWRDTWRAVSHSETETIGDTGKSTVTETNLLTGRTVVTHKSSEKIVSTKTSVTKKRSTLVSELAF